MARSHLHWGENVFIHIVGNVSCTYLDVHLVVAALIRIGFSFQVSKYSLQQIISFAGVTVIFTGIKVKSERFFRLTPVGQSRGVRQYVSCGNHLKAWIAVRK